MSEQVIEFLLSKGVLGFICILLLFVVIALWKTWRDDTKSFSQERTALYEQSREQERGNLTIMMGVLNDVKTSLALLLQRQS